MINIVFYIIPNKYNSGLNIIKYRNINDDIWHYLYRYRNT